MRMHNLVAFYGPKPISGGINRFFDEYKSFAEKSGCPINSVSVTPARRKGYVTLAKGVALLKKHGTENPTGMEAFSYPSDATKRMLDYSLAFSYAYEKPSCFTLSGFLDILPLNISVVFDLIKLAIENLKPRYGYGCSLAPDISPIFYSMGMTLYDPNHKIVKSGSPEHLQELTLARWGNIGIGERIWEAGVIRDVHPWNFLIAPQRAAMVENVTLESWIQAAGGSRGTLTSITPDISFWKVDPEEIPKIRNVLIEAGIVFTREQHLYYKAK